MKMINVLQRLAELDSQNPNIVPAKPQVTPDAAVEAIQKTLSEELSVESLKYLSGVKETIAECGMMPQSTSPASFSINASAANGEEVANMLNNIMALAGVQKVEPSMPADKPNVNPAPGMTSAGSDMKKILDTMNTMDQEENEGVLGTMAGAGLGAMAGGPLGAAVGGVAGDKFGDMISKEGDTEPDAGASSTEPEIDISGVGGALAGAAMHGDAEGASKGMQDGEDETMTGSNEEMRKLIDAVAGPEVDNTPADPTEVPPYVDDKHAYNPNKGDHRERQAGLARANPMEDVTSKLFADYEQFIAESKRG